MAKQKTSMIGKVVAMGWRKLLLIAVVVTMLGGLAYQASRPLWQPEVKKADVKPEPKGKQKLKLDQKK